MDYCTATLSLISVILQWRILSSLPVPKVGAAIVVVIWGLETKRLREGGLGEQIPGLTIHVHQATRLKFRGAT
jgi:hypothetical protein